MNVARKLPENPFEISPNTSGLRKCQKKAFDRVQEHFVDGQSDTHVLLQLPTGTGKSGIIAALPFGLRSRKTLILTPNLKLAKQMERDLDIIKHPNHNAYSKFKLFDSSTLADLKLYTLRLEGRVNRSDIQEHHILVANYHQLNDIEKWFANDRETVDLVIIDEAHHQGASTYQQIIKFFDRARIVGLTATPFRSDGKAVEGTKIFTYHFHEAIKDKVIRNIKTSNVSPKQIHLSFGDQEGKVYTLNELLKLKEDAWFNKGIALSQDCCDSIAARAKEKLEELQKTFPQTSHQIIAAAISVRHAREFVKPAFEKLGLKVGLVSSKEEDGQNDDVFNKLEQGKIQVIVHVNMLGEGFDHNKLGVAAIFRPFKSLNPYIQFIGRVIRQNDPATECYIVSHLGLNQGARFEEFKLFDREDQEFLESLIFEEGSSETDEQSFVDDQEGTQQSQSDSSECRIKEVEGELISFDTVYVKDQENVDILKGEFDKLSEEGKKAFLSRLGFQVDDISKVGKKRIKPVDERIAAKNLLNEKAKSIATDILNELKLKYKGRNFNKMTGNFAWIIRKVSREINSRMGIKTNSRQNLSNSELKSADQTKLLDSVKSDCLSYFRAKLSNRK